MGFTLHPQLATDAHPVGEFPLCRLLVMNDARYPWFILVPRRAAVREIYELSEADQAQLLKESSLLARAMMEVFGGDKLNIAALGNMVPQLHVHHIVRYTRDDSWPSPVWGRLPMKPYAPGERSARIDALCPRLPAEFQRSG